MKNRISKIFYLALLSGVTLFITTRCVKLDETPSDFVGPDNFYQSASQIESSFASAMNRIFGYWQFYDWQGYPAYPANTDENNGGDLVISDGFGNACWRNHYRAIADLNPAIQALNLNKLGTTVSDIEKAQLMAQAKFLRAFNYFALVRLYGDVPLIIETTDLIKDEIIRAPVADVYALIVSDLVYATQNLPPTWPSVRQGRPTMDAAKTLLAKVYITMATAPLNDASYYPKARDMAKQVINGGVYSLVPKIEEVFNLDNSYGPEMMWSFINSKDEDVIEPQIWLPGEMADGWGDVVCDLAWTEAYPEQPRKHAYLLLEDWEGNSYTTWDQGTASVKKFLYGPREDFENYVNYQNVVILRFADALLLYAEAENMVSGPIQAACDAANLIVDRANGGAVNPEDPRFTTSMSKQQFDDAIIRQRNLELCFEYDRWFDICRKRILDKVTIPEYLPNYSVDDYLLPIPQIDLRLNLKLSQNPGYTDPTP